ncbi:SAM-dependent methyltransferase [Pleionea sediminis]|uniref:SAM-dependent methyltransferase n=1 Tax=Pleionea sediminis TaxID=2569479 RepID=UPI0011846F5B|nr:cyclopropane-fatty-acyl-phospholipid synthase family protein [Pleionea sediminis]
MAESQLITHKLKQTTGISAKISTGISRFLVENFFRQMQIGEVTLIENGDKKVFGKNQDIKAQIIVNDTRFYSRLLSGGSIGAGEAYIEGWWDSPDTTAVVELFAANLDIIDRIEGLVDWVKLPFKRILKPFKTNTKKRAKKNIVAHYDLGNVLYKNFLDPTMLYSAAIYPDEKASLYEASLHKLKVICDSLELSKDDHLVEIGTGWGGLAVFAAKNYGCKVTTTTISEEQYNYTAQLLKENGIDDKVTLLKRDYRELEGQFDKLVSIEMIEAVGHEYLSEYFQVCNRLLKPGGKMLIQSILIDDNRYDQYVKGEDFIQKYIFPGGALPSKKIVHDTVAANTSLRPIGYFSFGYDYARTLEDWRKAFNKNWAEIRTAGYDDKFYRLWNFYFHYCEGGFWQDRIDVAHFVFEK